MSIFDPPKQDKLSDDFTQGTLFWLLAAQYDGVQPTSFGESVQASIVACPIGEEHNQKQYRVWGTLAEQVQQMEEGDLPAEVEVVKQGRKNVWRLSKKLHDVTPAEVPEEEPPF